MVVHSSKSPPQRQADATWSFTHHEVNIACFSAQVSHVPLELGLQLLPDQLLRNIVIIDGKHDFALCIGTTTVSGCNGLFSPVF
jgi:hypothetical protein